MTIGSPKSTARRAICHHNHSGQNSSEQPYPAPSRDTGFTPCCSKRPQTMYGAMDAGRRRPAFGHNGHMALDRINASRSCTTAFITHVRSRSVKQLRSVKQRAQKRCTWWQMRASSPRTGPQMMHVVASASQIPGSVQAIEVDALDQSASRTRALEWREDGKRSRAFNRQQTQCAPGGQRRGWRARARVDKKRSLIDTVTEQQFECHLTNCRNCIFVCKI